jgi:hypothetical protein
VFGSYAVMKGERRMYEELIAKMNPCPKFNLQWYKNEDLYSDGEVEDFIIKIIAENRPEDYSNAVYEQFNWPIYYHLSPLRKNILNWYKFKPDSSVLEIGCGMGAITSVLCDECKDVTAVELSRKRATATLLRCREKENLEIIVGNLNDIEFDKKFDYITLIGVLEYQGTYTESTNPYMDFLVKIKQLLKPDGKLLVAIENQYGLKYWCGMPEDHVGIPFEGINQYRDVERGVRTFSKTALDTLIKESGFHNTYFYYPYPDYKLPTVIYSQDVLPSKKDTVNSENFRGYSSAGENTLIANEKNLYMDIVENHVFEFFTNSFLVECSDSSQLGEITFARLTSERKEQYRMATRFTRDSTVEKKPLTMLCAQTHVRQLFKNVNILKQAGIKIVEYRADNGMVVSDYIEKPLLEDVILNALKEGNTDEIYRLIDLMYGEILRSSEQISWKDNILYTLDLGIEENEELFGPILKIGFLDMSFRNAFYCEGEILWFDQEWVLEAVPAKFILYYVLTLLYYSYPQLEGACPSAEVIAHYHMQDACEAFEKLRELFGYLVSDEAQVMMGRAFSIDSTMDYISNVKKLMK